MSTRRLQVSNGTSNDNRVKELVKLSTNDDKYCCIKSCSNPGSENVRTNKVKEKCQRPPTFKLREENWEVSRDWIQRICASSWGQTFDPGVDEVCAEHFTEDCIQKSDAFILNGKKYSAPRSKLTWTLWPSAVPTIFEPLNLPGRSSGALPIISTPLVGARDSIVPTWYWCFTCKNFTSHKLLESHLQISATEQGQLARDHDESKTSSTGHRILRIGLPPVVKISRLSDFQTASLMPKTEKKRSSLRLKTKDVNFEDSDLEGKDKDIPWTNPQNIRNHIRRTDQSKIINNDFNHTRSEFPYLYFCSLCVSHAFRNRNILAHHMKSNHMDKTTKSFKCPHCPKSKQKCWSVKIFNSHYRRVHLNSSGFSPIAKRELNSERASYTCDFPGCNYVGRLKYKINAHKEMHEKGLSESEPSRVPYVCDKPGCNYIGRMKYKINAHKEMHEKGLAQPMSTRVPYTCDQPGCKYVGLLESKIKTHKEKHEKVLIEPPKPKREQSSLLDEKEKPFVCTICNKAFNQRHHLRVHVYNHLKLSPFTCKFCNAKFKRRHCRDRHEELHFSRPVVSCPICHGTLSRASFLSKHMKTCHLKESKRKKAYVVRKRFLRVKPIVKNECDEASLTNCQNLPNGQAVIQQISNLTSQNEKSPSKQGTPTPVFEIIPKPEMNETNGDCTQKEVGLQSISSTTVQTDEEDSPQSSHEQLDTLIRAEVHKLIGPEKNQYKLSQVKHKCHLCSRTFLRVFLLQLHLQKHHGVHDPWHKGVQDKQGQDPQVEIITSCGVCGFSSKDPKTLKVHTKSHFPPGRDFPCRICGIRFVTEEKVKSHIKFIHEVPREHHCNSCDKSFVTHAHLKCHMRKVHSDVLKGPFNCSDCGSKFQSLGGLQNHIRSTHSKFVETFKCQICSETLATRQSLQRHIRRVHIKSNVKKEVKESSKPEELFL